MTDCIVSMSGGMGSFAEAAACVEAYGKENVTLLFADTLMEDEDLYRFLKECVAWLGCELVTLTEGRTPFQVFKDCKLMGNTQIDPCSRVLKRELMTEYIHARWPSPRDVEIHVGIDYSEGHRLERLQKRGAPYIYRSLICEAGRIIQKDYSQQAGIKPPRLYSWRLGHNNCGGFCVKAGQGHYSNLYKANPERYKEFELKELEVYHHIGAYYPFLRVNVLKEKTYLTLQEFREEILEQGKLAPEAKTDFGACGCLL